MSFLSESKLYGSWSEKKNQLMAEFDKTFYDKVLSANVTERDFTDSEGNPFTSRSICLHLENGCTYQPLSSKSKLEAGDEVKVASLRVITLEKPGEKDIYRLDGEKA